jgi:hypothetical protein
MWPSPAVQLTQRDTIRLISTGRLKEPVLLPLAANQGALDDLADLESVTNGRLIAAERARRRLIKIPDPRDLTYNERTTAERANARIKDEFGGRHLRVRGHLKAFCHLMFGVVALAADSIVRLFSARFYIHPA